MTAKRDGSFPATSIGRVQGAHIARNPSFESLSAHPLLASSSNPDLQHPKYVPYTPRHHRVPSPFATTGTTLDSSTALSAQPHHGAAATKLQSVNSRAALQSMGLTATSVGWAMLEKILNEPAHDVEWNDIWNTITIGKATLLLPSEDTTTHNITPEFMKDHIIFWDGSTRKNAPIVTSSGLRGILTDDKLVFRSSLYPLSRPFQDIQGAFSRSSALTALPSLTFPSGFPADFPAFTVTSYNQNLPLPPRAMASSKPNALGRSSMRMPLNASSRLSNTFTSLFGKSAVVTPSDSAATPSDPEITVNISTFTIDCHIDVQDVGKKINQTLKLELENSLTALPSRVRDCVLEFAQDLCPLVKSSPELSAAGHNATPYAINMLQETPAQVSQRFQDFYQDVEGRLTHHDDTSIEQERADADGNNYERHPAESVVHESAVREALELVERTICSLFYDRIYLLPTSDDASHDETLSSRIAALNMLDLTLEHLDVHVGDSGLGLDLVVKSCGDSLTRLESSVHSPAEKAALLVAAHKLVVEGLSSIQLKSGTESKTVHDQDRSYEVAGDENSSPPSALDNDSSQSDAVSATTSAEIVPISGDMLLPLIIFSVVKANPPHLVSHLLYIQRFRNKSVSGEESYCLINLLAVVEFLENVDLVALGLADSESKVLSAATLTPIQISRAPMIPNSPQQEQGTHHGGGLRGRVEQQVDAITGSAGKVISGVVDSFGMLRMLLPGNPDPSNSEGETTQTSTPWNYIPSQFGLLRREAGLSIASIAASLPGTSVRGNSRSGQTEEIGQPLVTVSRPSSIRNGDAQDDEDSDKEGSDDGEPGDGHSSADHRESGEHDSRSIRSFESMMTGKGRDWKDISRRSISDRLASVSGLVRPHSKDPETGLKAPNPFVRLGSPTSSRPTSPASVRIAPPSQRFLDMTEDDIKVSDVGELLREYKRVVDALRASGGFED